jgi:hypothetical protein
MRTTLLFLFGLILGFSSCDTGQVRIAVTLPMSIPLLKREMIYYQVNSQVPFTGILTVMHRPDGNAPSKTAVAANFKAGKLHGNVKEFYRSGQLFKDLTYANGKMHGVCKVYGSNGQLLIEGNYAMGNNNGLLTCYEPNGAVALKAIFAASNTLTLHGLAIRWRPRTDPLVFGYGEIGDIVADSGTFTKGVPTGQWKTSTNQDRGGPGVVMRGQFDATGKAYGTWTLSLGQSPKAFARVVCDEGPVKPYSGPEHTVTLIEAEQGVTLAQAQDLARSLHSNFGSNLARTFRSEACWAINPIIPDLIEYSEMDLP